MGTLLRHTQHKSKTYRHFKLVRLNDTSYSSAGGGLYLEEELLVEY